MKPKSFMLIAGEASGDMLAAELVGALRQRIAAEPADATADVQPLRTALAPRFFGAGGPKMAAAGVELAFDLTQHSVIGITELVKKYRVGRQLFNQLVRLALDRQPDVIIGIDYGFFNLRFARAIKNHVRKHRGAFNNWHPRIVQFVSPQVWASRPGRAYQLQEDHDLLLSIFPFEKAWYAMRTPGLRVEFVGHPMVGRHTPEGRVTRVPNSEAMGTRETRPSQILLLPGSRVDEVRRHWPVVTGAFQMLRRELPQLRGKMILPSDALLQSVKPLGVPDGLELQVGGLTAALAEADLAITKSGTITMECALFGVPAVVFYKTSWPTYLIGRQIVNVKYLAMPNLLADAEIFPEFIQHAATPENLAHASLDLLKNTSRRQEIQARLKGIVASLGGPGASRRAADAVMRLLG